MTKPTLNPKLQQYMDMQRTSYNSWAGRSLQDAQAAVHVDYRAAARQAPYTLANIIREFYDRQPKYQGDTIDDIVSSIGKDTPRPRLLDFGCAVGRLMEACVASGYQVDGVDISEEMLRYAHASPTLRAAGCNLYLGSGCDCGSAPAGQYDIIYSLLCFQHICVRTIRNSILRSMASLLTPRGMVYIQMQYYPYTPSGYVPNPHSAWSIDNTAATSTNSCADVWMTPDQLDLVYHDFSWLFKDVRMQFIDVPGEFVNSHQMHRVVISGSSNQSIAENIYCGEK